MMRPNHIQTYEWSKLHIDQQGFSESHRSALLKLNELHGFNYLDLTHQGVCFRNYVGIIQVGNLTIEILPKADIGKDKTNWRDVLVHMLKVAKKVQVHDKGEAFAVSYTHLTLPTILRV